MIMSLLLYNCVMFVYIIYNLVMLLFFFFISLPFMVNKRFSMFTPIPIELYCLVIERSTVV